MKENTYIGIGFALMALGSLVGVFFPQIRKWTWEGQPFSAVTSGLYCLLFAEIALYCFNILILDVMTMGIPVVTIMFLFGSIFLDIYRAESFKKRLDSKDNK